ncbi:uncharacterized protein J8A68_004014 [[Candida] subhashii]|uniref:RING-type E3 ubiquitin transferase n=1 Tax=[Candida] subhashii TaxID=561895 RepID=A0A8J5QL66_9ASCO|nr:uncharacterized protein J8A68_004014 [[Candida] subhashii]KAG7662483.1 hypothetical protein J8A68_004014 [[Candida] subhashii]
MRIKGTLGYAILATAVASTMANEINVINERNLLQERGFLGDIFNDVGSFFKGGSATSSSSGVTTQPTSPASTVTNKSATNATVPVSVANDSQNDDEYEWSCTTIYPSGTSTSIDPLTDVEPTDPSPTTTVSSTDPEESSIDPADSSTEQESTPIVSADPVDTDELSSTNTDPTTTAKTTGTTNTPATQSVDPPASSDPPQSSDDWELECSTIYPSDTSSQPPVIQSADPVSSDPAVSVDPSVSVDPPVSSEPPASSDPIDPTVTTDPTISIDPPASSDPPQSSDDDWELDCSTIYPTDTGSQPPVLPTDPPQSSVDPPASVDPPVTVNPTSVDPPASVESPTSTDSAQTSDDDWEYECETIYPTDTASQPPVLPTDPPQTNTINTTPIVTESVDPPVATNPPQTSDDDEWVEECETIVPTVNTSPAPVLPTAQNTNVIVNPPASTNPPAEDDDDDEWVEECETIGENGTTTVVLPTTPAQNGDDEWEEECTTLATTNTVATGGAGDDDDWEEIEECVTSTPTLAPSGSNDEWEEVEECTTASGADDEWEEIEECTTPIPTTTVKPTNVATTSVAPVQTTAASTIATYQGNGQINKANGIMSLLIDKQTLTTFQNQLKQFKAQLNNSQYDNGYGNLTGFKLSYEDQLSGKSDSDWPIHRFDKDHPWIENEKYSILPNIVSENVKKFWGNDPVETVDGDAAAAYLLNISGTARGEFRTVKQTNIKPQQLEIPKYLKDYFNSLRNNLPDNENSDSPISGIPAEKQGNITKANGLISLALYPSDYNYKNPRVSKFIYNESTDKIDNAVSLHMYLKLSDYPEKETHNLNLRGVYFQETGSIIGVTNSAKFSGNYALNHLAMNKDNFKISKTLYSQLMNLTNIDKEVVLDDVNGQIIKANEQCEYVTYFQLAKTNYSKQDLRMIDDELRSPTGRPIPNDIPKIEIKDFLAYSPDCGIVLTNRPDTSFQGLRKEVSTAKERKFIFGIALLLAVELLLYIRQMKASRTPGQLTIISGVTLFWLMWGDMTLGFCSLFFANMFLVVCCVLGLIFCVILLQMRFMFFVMNAQVNERGTTWWEILRGGLASRDTTDSTSETTTTTTTNTNTDTGPIIPMTNAPPAAAAAQPAATPTTNEWQNDGSVSNGSMVVCMSFSILSMFFIFNAFTWGKTQRAIAEYIGLFAINSYWIPQFLRNTLKNRRESYKWEFILGISLIRLSPVIYVCTFTTNPFRHRFDPHLAIFITSWVMFQIILLILQQRIGPRFWVNENWLPKAYDYQQIISLADLESGFSSDLLTNIKHRSDQEQDIMDCECTCPICKDEVMLPILVKSDNADARRKIKNREYMITPCHHIFHAECLENWMKYKLQCPINKQTITEDLLDEIVTENTKNLMNEEIE